MASDRLAKMLHEIMTRAADGREVIWTPDNFIERGPCPYCGSPIEPAPFTFVEGMAANKVSPKSLGLSGTADGYAGIIVCGSCAKPVVFDQPGKFLKLPREKLRQLPRITQRFVKSEQEAIARRKRAVN